VAHGIDEVDPVRLDNKSSERPCDRTNDGGKEEIVRPDNKLSSKTMRLDARHWRSKVGVARR
jgi:hypothetical protein